MVDWFFFFWGFCFMEVDRFFVEDIEIFVLVLFLEKFCFRFMK